MLRFAIVPVAVGAALAFPASAAGDRPHDPMRFFEGKTESVSTVKVLMRKPYQSVAMGTGKIGPDGTLDFVQHVKEEGHPPKIRRWTVRQVSKGRFSGTMNEALGPVSIDEVSGRYRFRFKMKGNLSVEQWLTPQSDWRAARNHVTIKRFGIKVASSDGTIRKIG